MAVIDRVANHDRDRARGLGQVVRHIRDQIGALCGLHEKRVRKTVHMDAVLAAHALRPVVRQLAPGTTHQIKPRPARQRRAHLKARGIDDAVDRILGAAHHDAGLGDPLDALAVGVHQMDGGGVEGLQIGVMKAGPLAQLPVPGLQMIGGRRVGHDLVDPCADLVHFGEVGIFVGGQHVRHGALGGRQLADLLADASRQIGPAVLHQIDLGIAAGLIRGEVLEPALLPARRGHARKPVGVDRRVVSNIDRRRRALKYMQRPTAARQVRHALH